MEPFARTQCTIEQNYASFDDMTLLISWTWLGNLDLFTNPSDYAADFAVIDREIGAHNFNLISVAIVQRVIYSTAGIWIKQLIVFVSRCTEGGIVFRPPRKSIVTDVYC